jgi:glycosyltransferase involved in cell wall biosynthesis
VLEPYFKETTEWHNVRNPISFDKQPRVCAEKNAKFFFVGRVCKEKGIDLFLQAARDCCVEAIVIGDGPELESSKIRFPEVAYLGWLSSKEIKEQLRLARAFVFPSLWYEGLPLAVQEAKSMGVPAIVANGTAAREIVESGISGLHFEHQNHQSLVKAILKIKEDDALVQELSMGSYDSYWADPPSRDSHVAQLSKVYQLMIAKKDA